MKNLKSTITVISGMLVIIICIAMGTMYRYNKKKSWDNYWCALPAINTSKNIEHKGLKAEYDAILQTNITGAHLNNLINSMEKNVTFLLKPCNTDKFYVIGNNLWNEDELIKDSDGCTYINLETVNKSFLEGCLETKNFKLLNTPVVKSNNKINIPTILSSAVYSCYLLHYDYEPYGLVFIEQ